MTADDPAAPPPEYKARGIDALLVRYSRWRRRRLARLAEVPLAALALETLYLSACILADAVVLPWIVVLVAGGFSFALFGLLFLPTVVAEAVLYRRVKATPRNG